MWLAIHSDRNKIETEWITLVILGAWSEHGRTHKGHSSFKSELALKYLDI